MDIPGPDSRLQGESFYGGGTCRAPGDSGSKYVRALELETGKIAWEVPVEGGILESGVMSTAGGLVFYGDRSGAFVAVDAGTGKLLWHFKAGQSWRAGPMSYSIDGRQYIGVATDTTIMVFGLP